MKELSSTHRNPARRLPVVVLLATAALSACVVAPASRRAAYPVEEVVVEAGTPPPAPYTETIPAAPYPAAVWIGGHWDWSGGRHVWAPGRWAQPRPGYRWQPRRWEPGARGGWVLRGGYWAR